MLEVGFGTVVWLGPLSFIDELGRTCVLIVSLLGFFWVVMAFSLDRGSRVGRTIGLALSVLRLFTLVGLPFSLVFVWKTYINSESKAFFRDARRELSE